MKIQPLYDINDRLFHRDASKVVKIIQIKISEHGVFYSVQPRDGTLSYDVKESMLDLIKLKKASVEVIQEFYNLIDQWQDQHRVLKGDRMVKLAVAEWEANKVGLTIYYDQVGQS